MNIFLEALSLSSAEAVSRVLSFPRMRESIGSLTIIQVWIPAFAGMTLFLEAFLEKISGSNGSFSGSMIPFHPPELPIPANGSRGSRGRMHFLPNLLFTLCLGMSVIIHTHLCLFWFSAPEACFLRSLKRRFSEVVRTSECKYTKFFPQIQIKNPHYCP